MTDGHHAGPGWYVDPVADGAERYWDGRSWTMQTRPRAQPSTPTPAPMPGAWAPPDPAPAPPIASASNNPWSSPSAIPPLPPPPTPGGWSTPGTARGAPPTRPATPPSTRRRAPLLIGAVVLVALIAGITVLATRSSDSTETAASSSTTEVGSAASVKPRTTPVTPEEMAALTPEAAEAMIPRVIADARQQAHLPALRHDERLDTFLRGQYTPDHVLIFTHEFGELLADQIGPEATTIAPIYFERLAGRRSLRTPVYDDAELRYFASSPAFNRWGMATGQVDGQPTVLVLFSGAAWAKDDQPRIEQWVADGFPLARQRSGLVAPPHSTELDRLARQLVAFRNEANTVVARDIVAHGRPISYGCVSSRRVPYAFEATTTFPPDDSMTLLEADGYGVAIQPDGDRFRYCTVMSFPKATAVLAAHWQTDQRELLDAAMDFYNGEHPSHTGHPSADPALATAAGAEAKRLLVLLVAAVMDPAGGSFSSAEMRTPSPEVSGHVNGYQRSVSIQDASMAELMDARQYGLGYAVDPTTGLSIEVVFWR